MFNPLHLRIMIITGRISKVLPLTSGTSAGGNEWRRQDFIFEFFENPSDRFPDKVLLSLLNDKIKEYAPNENEEVTIGIGHRVDEYNGKYYNKLYVYSFERASAQAVKEQPASIQDAPAVNKTEEQDDLPF